MGTQQILMIILSVIVVGAAVAVAIQMFDTQANNLASMALKSELQNQAVMAQAWFRTPEMMSGGNYDIANVDAATIARYIDRSATSNTIKNATGEFTIVAVDSMVTITAVHASHPTITAEAVINLKQGYQGIKIEDL